MTCLIALLASTETTAIEAFFVVRRARDDALHGHSGSAPPRDVDPVKTLTAREREVYDLVCQGISTAQIARHPLHLGGTVKVHVHRLFDNLEFGRGLRLCWTRRIAAAVSSTDAWRRGNRPKCLADGRRPKLRPNPGTCCRPVVLGHSARIASNATTTPVSNWVSIAWRSRSRAARVVIASIRAVGGHRVVRVGDPDDLREQGISGPGIPSGYPSPSIRSWWWRTILATSSYVPIS